MRSWAVLMVAALAIAGAGAGHAFAMERWIWFAVFVLAGLVGCWMVAHDVSVLHRQAMDSRAFSGLVRGEFDGRLVLSEEGKVFEIETMDGTVEVPVREVDDRG